jgi:hypothetical protein
VAGRGRRDRDQPGEGEDGPRSRVRRHPGPGRVDQALGLAAAAGRFDDADLGAILDHLATRGEPGDLVRVDESFSAQPGTASWERFGR